MILGFLNHGDFIHMFSYKQRVKLHSQFIFKASAEPGNWTSFQCVSLSPCLTCSSSISLYGPWGTVEHLTKVRVYNNSSPLIHQAWYLILKGHQDNQASFSLYESVPTVSDYVLVLHVFGVVFQKNLLYWLPRDWEEAECLVVAQILLPAFLEDRSEICFLPDLGNIWSPWLFRNNQE